MPDAARWTARLTELARASGVPGAVLGIWADGQEVLAAYGVLNAATAVRVTADSLFQVGSITKIWTATMIMQLLDEAPPARRGQPSAWAGAWIAGTARRLSGTTVTPSASPRTCASTRRPG